MIIKESNKAKIDEMIKKAEGRATMRTITYKDIVDAIAKIEKKLDIPKCKMVGIRASVDIHAQNYPRAYKYTAESTHFAMVRKSSGWDFLGADRCDNRREGHQFLLKLTDEAKQAILDRCEDF